MLAARTHAAGRSVLRGAQIVTWHYQWMVLHDFVERITETGIVAKILHDGRKFYRFKKVPVHAGRVLGGRLSARPQHGARGLQPQPHLHARRRRSGHAATAVRVLGPVRRHHRRSRAESADGADADSVLPSNWIIDWRRFYDFKTPAGARTSSSTLAQARSVRSCRSCTRCRAAAATSRSATCGAAYPGPAFGSGRREGDGRCRTRSRRTRSRAGRTAPCQEARPPSEDAALVLHPEGSAGARQTAKRSARWARRIVAEVFVGLVHGDHESYLWLRARTGSRTLPSKTPGTFTMTDLLQFVGDISPIDGITTVNTL